jgi:hypothetical protein
MLLHGKVGVLGAERAVFILVARSTPIFPPRGGPLLPPKGKRLALLILSFRNNLSQIFDHAFNIIQNIIVPEPYDFET